MEYGTARSAEDAYRAFAPAVLGFFRSHGMREPEDLTGAVLFLLSDEARWVTGHVLNVDGGQWMRT